MKSTILKSFLNQSIEHQPANNQMPQLTKDAVIENVTQFDLISELVIRQNADSKTLIQMKDEILDKMTKFFDLGLQDF